MKKVVFFLLLFAMLCGCAQTTAIQSIESSDSKIVLEYWDVQWCDSNSVEYTRALNERIATYCAENPEVSIQVRTILQEDVYNAFLSAAVSGNTPDICSCPMAQPVYFSELGQALDLSPILEQWHEESSPIPDLLKSDMLSVYSVDGIQAAIPYGIDCRVLYYRSDYFAEAGITDVPNSINEFAAAFRAVREKYPEIKPFVFSADTKSAATAASLFFLSMNGATSEMVTMDAAITGRNSISSYRILAEWIENEFVTDEVLTSSNEDVQRSFLAGEACMILTSPVAAWLNESDLYGVCNVAATPAGTYAIRGYTYYSPVCYQGFSDTEYPDEVCNFIKWMCENNLELFTDGKSSILPLREDYGNVLSAQDENIGEIYEMIHTHGRMSNYPHTGIYPFQYILQQQGILGAPLRDILSGVDVLEALSKADIEYEKILKNFES